MTLRNGTPGRVSQINLRDRCPILSGLPPSRRHVTTLHHRMAATPVQANNVIITLSQIYAKAQDWGIVAEGTNPCRHVELYRQRKRERFLTEPEFRRLGRVLDEAAQTGGATPEAIAAIRLLILTGCRRGWRIVWRRMFCRNLTFWPDRPDLELFKRFGAGLGSRGIVGAVQVYPSVSMAVWFVTTFTGWTSVSSAGHNELMSCFSILLLDRPSWACRVMAGVKP